MDKEKFSLLSNIKYPEDLRKLSIDELPELCRNCARTSSKRWRSTPDISPPRWVSSKSP